MKRNWCPAVRASPLATDLLFLKLKSTAARPAKVDHVAHNPQLLPAGRLREDFKRRARTQRTQTEAPRSAYTRSTPSRADWRGPLAVPVLKIRGFLSDRTVLAKLLCRLHPTPKPRGSQARSEPSTFVHNCLGSPHRFSCNRFMRASPAGVALRLHLCVESGDGSLTINNTKAIST